MQKSYALSEEDVEDITAFAFQRLITVPTNKHNVPAYIRTAINNSCRTELSHILKLRKRHDDVGANVLQVKDPRPTADVVLLNHDLVLRAISRLSPEERYVINRTWLLSGCPAQTPQQIAATLHISRPELLRMLDSIYAKLRSWIEHPE
jgi:DNA-directed RNA polymerase specialized sigma24 family protein